MSFHRFRVFFILAVVALCFTARVVCASEVKIDPQDLKNIMLVKDIKPGMKGYGKTVFKGTKVETFDVEVLGVMEKMNVGTELILVKCSGGPLTERGANVVQGMSGSPIYIDGKIIGAIAYGNSFAKEPISLVTPIQYMLEAWDPGLPSKPSSFFPYGAGGSYGGEALGSFDLSKLEPSKVEFGGMVFRPLEIPVMVSGMSPSVLSWLSERLRPFSLNPVAGPGAAKDLTDSGADIGPGSSVGISFVTGDIDMSGVGTVTYRRGDRIVAFGHPIFSGSVVKGIGPINMPLSTSYVFDVYPSYMVSFKLASPGNIIGSVTQDRPWAISGTIGKMPNMIPVSVRVKDLSAKRTRDFRFEVIEHPMLSGTLITSATAESISQMKLVPTDYTAKIRFTVEADEIGKVTRENTVFDPMTVDMSSVDELYQVLSLLQFNPFHPVGIKSVNVEVSMEAKHQTARLERVFVKESKFEPGQNVEVGVVLKPFSGEKVARTVSLKLPENMPNGRYQIYVGGGAYLNRLALSQDPGGQGSRGSSSGRATVENLKQLIDKFLEMDKSDDLVAKIVLPKSVLSISGEKLSGLPPTIEEAMKSSKTTALGTDRDEIKTVVPTEWVINGAQRLTITVAKRDMSEKKTPARRTPPPSEDSPQPDMGDAQPDSMEGEEMGYEDYMLPVPASSGIVQLADSDAEIGDVEGEETDEDVPAPSEEPAEKKSGRPSGGDKPVGRLPAVWNQTSREDFLKGDMVNVSSCTDGSLFLMASLELFKELDETYIWCIMPNGSGSVYVGTGNKGVIYNIAPDGSESVVFDSPELEVHCMAKDSKGNVYAGTSPNGMVYKIDSAGKAEAFYDADEKYVLALAVDGRDNLYAATGDRGRVYRIGPDGKAQVALDSPESSVLSLAVDGKDNIYAGTGQSGIIYKIGPDGAVSVIYDSSQAAITALTVTKDGVLYAGSSPKGIIYKLAPGAAAEVVYDKAGKSITAVTSVDSGDVYAASLTDIFRIMPDDTVCTIRNKRDLQFLSLAARDGVLYAGTGNIGSIARANIGDTVSGVYESPIHDCGLSSKWGVIKWNAETPAGTSVALQTRAGDTPVPDATWSGWSSDYANSGVGVAGEPARYIQYRVTLASEDPAVAPKLKDVSIVYLPRNQAPKVTVSAPKGGECWSGKKDISWKGADPDKDNLSYQVYYSSNRGLKWTLLEDGIKTSEPSADEGAGRDKKLPVEAPEFDQGTFMDEVRAELENHPDISPEIKDEIIAEAESMAVSNELPSQAASAPGASGNGATRRSKQTWDTAKVKDGRYVIKVVASDKPGNPEDALSGDDVSDEFTVCNTPPNLNVFSKTITVGSDNAVTAEGLAYHGMIAVAGVQYRVDGGDWTAVAASDGIFDSGSEPFVIRTEPLSKGSHKVDVKAVDEAGNSKETKFDVKVL